MREITKKMTKKVLKIKRLNLYFNRQSYGDDAKNFLGTIGGKK